MGEHVVLVIALFPEGVKMTQGRCAKSAESEAADQQTGTLLGVEPFLELIVALV